MVTNTQHLDWLTVDLELTWKVPKAVHKPAEIYTKLWGLIQTINTTTAELTEQIKLADGRLRPILQDTLATKYQYYPTDDFPLIAFHPTQGTYHQNKLLPDTSFFLSISFGGEHLHLAHDWVDWMQARLRLKNTGFAFAQVIKWHQHSKILPNLYAKHRPEIDHSQQKTFLVDMPINLIFNKHIENLQKKTSVAQMLVVGLLEGIQKRLIQWFPTQKTHIERWVSLHSSLLYQSRVCIYQLYEQHHIKTISKSSATTGTQIQFHDGYVGYLTLKGAWAQIGDLWQIMQSIHLLGQRSKINGLGLILDCDQLVHPPRSLMAQHFAQVRHVAQAVNEVLEQHDLEPEWDDKGQIIQSQALAQLICNAIETDTYQPQPTTAFAIEKPNGGHRILEQLSQKDMIVHRLIFRALTPIIDRYQSPMSIGYRKGYSRQMAKDRVQELIDAGYGWVIEADIEDFFNSVPLDRLWAQLAEIFSTHDADTIELLKKLMHAPAIHHKKSPFKLYQNINIADLPPRERGLMQGSPLSPILANLYLSQLDEAISKLPIEFVRYADDVLIFCRSNKNAETTLSELDATLTKLGLNLSLTKTCITKVSDGFEFLGYRFDSEGSEDNAVVPILKQRKPVIVTGSTKYLSVNGEALEVRMRHHIKVGIKSKPNKPQQPTVKSQSQLISMIPFRRISQLIIMGNHALSSPLLTACAKSKISVHFVNHWGFQVGTLNPIHADYFAISAKQYHRHQSLKPSGRLAIAIDIVHAKINNYQTWIKNSYRKSDNTIISQLESLKSKLTSSTHINQLMGYEGQASKLCFRRIQGVLIDEQKKAFYSPRRSRGGKDRLNSILNFGYYWLFTRISALLRSHGLNPYLSFLHESNQSYETLVYDIMEIFRVQVDKTVVRLINRKQIQAKDFHMHERKGWQLNHEALHLFSNQLQATFTSQINQSCIEDILLVQVRSIQAWAANGDSLSWFCWHTDKSNPTFHTINQSRNPMVIDDDSMVA